MGSPLPTRDIEQERATSGSLLLHQPIHNQTNKKTRAHTTQAGLHKLTCCEKTHTHVEVGKPQACYKKWAGQISLLDILKRFLERSCFRRAF
jgi:hypothetical protein